MLYSFDMPLCVRVSMKFICRRYRTILGLLYLRLLRKWGNRADRWHYVEKRKEHKKRPLVALAKANLIAIHQLSKFVNPPRNRAGNKAGNNTPNPLKSVGLGGR